MATSTRFELLRRTLPAARGRLLRALLDDIAFDHDTVGGVDREFFRRSDFLVNGTLPSPAP
jgi:hypothetical protein